MKRESCCGGGGKEGEKNDLARSSKSLALPRMQAHAANDELGDGCGEESFDRC